VASAWGRTSGSATISTKPAPNHAISAPRDVTTFPKKPMSSATKTTIDATTPTVIATPLD